MTPETSLPFATARSSRNHGLVAFAAVLFLAFAASAGAFVPPLDAPARSAGEAARAAAYSAAPAAPAKCG